MPPGVELWILRVVASGLLALCGWFLRATWSMIAKMKDTQEDHAERIRALEITADFLTKTHTLRTEP